MSLKKVFWESFCALFLLTVFGAFLRLWKIDKYPVGFTPDEAAQGYTAYSLLKTGRDEWGGFFPLNLRSFGDFKPPLQTYLIIPSVVFFGLNEWAVRFPNALLSSLAIPGVFLLAKEFFNLEIGLLAAALLAFSPWHVQLSRGAFEANLTVFFISFGIYFLLKALRTREIAWQILAALFLGLNMFSYHSAKLFTPLLVIFVIAYFFFPLKNYKFTISNFRISVFYLLYSVFLVVAFSSFFFGGQKRGLDIAIFHPTDNWHSVREERYFAVGRGLPDVVARLFHNKLIYSLSIFFKNYFSYFSPQFLFSEGPGEGTYGMIPGRGVLWWWELPVIVFGLISFFRKPSKKLCLIFSALLLAPVFPALTKSMRSANRVAVMMPWIQLFIAVSIFDLISKILIVKNDKIKRFRFFYMIFSSLLVVFPLLFFAFFLEDYFIQSPRKIAKEMLYGRCEALKKIANYQNGRTVVVSRKISEPQTYVMFCLGLDPKEVQEQTKQWLVYEEKGLSFVDQLGEYQLDKFLFKEINWSSDSLDNKVILIGKPEEFPEKIIEEKKKSVVFYPDGTPSLIIYGI